MKIFDIHCDVLQKRTGFIENWLKASENSTIDSVVCANWTTELSEKKVFDNVQKYEKAKVNSKINILLSYEDLHFIDAKNINHVIASNPIWCGLCWNGENKLAGGVYSERRLSEFGKKVVKKLENSGILIDCAHLNEQSFLDVARCSKRKLVCSHTAFFDCNNHIRNIKEYQIRIILESGGIVGLAFVADFLCGCKRADVSHVVRQITWFCNRFGSTNGLSIGTDFWGTKHLPYKLKNYYDFELLKLKLENAGFSSNDIDNLFYCNAEKFVKNRL